MKPFVVYYSKTGNTRKVASEIAKTLDVKAHDVKGVKNTPDTSFLIAGSGVYAGKPGKEMVEFLNNLPAMKGKKAAIFETSRNGEELNAGKVMKAVLEKKGAKIVDRFVCPGQLFYVLRRGHPTEEDLENARKFAESLKSHQT